MATGSLIEAIESVLAIGDRTDVASDASSATVVSLLRMLQKANRSSVGEVVRKTVAFDGEAGNGAQGTVALFTVTGVVRAKVTCYCTETIVGAGTLEVGIAGATAAIIAQIADAENLIAGEIWHDATPDAEIELASVAVDVIIADGNDVIATIGTADITDGTIVLACEWEPVSADGAVVAA